MSDFEEVTKILKARYLKNKPEFDAIARRLKAQNDREFPKFIERMQKKIK
ncbi:hypothetical protein A3SAC12_0036 [Lactobacillus phage 3-SAC12]|nr:hypothetical protein A3SAC12_0036 [Lactobacillus phage 3-SAC12]